MSESHRTRREFTWLTWTTLSHCNYLCG